MGTTTPTAPPKKTATAAKPATLPLALNSEVVMLLPDEARQLRDTCHFERQRKLSEDHILHLAQEMERGSFIPGTQITFGVYPDRHMAILNGNHTLEAVSLSSVPIALTFTYIPVRDDDDAGAIYAQFDIHRVRSWGDAYHAYGFAETIPGYWSTIIGTAVGMIMTRFNTAGARGAAYEFLRSRKVRTNMMRPYAKQIAMILDLVTGTSLQQQAILRRQGVMSVALETLKHQPTAAAEFWRGFLMDDGLGQGDPRKTLLNYLRARTGKSDRTCKDQQARACALAWNAYFTSKTITVLRAAYVDEIHIAGTPWVRKGYDPMTPLLDDSIPVKPKSIQVSAVARPSYHSGVQLTANGETTAVVYYSL